ncbi:Nif3-like dinuclear metal center hexameric protein [Marinomonas ostreistagni]|uniref:Nif3-like dinuclear metal center hexameric protein n=1 Tax=Marinomonas ostreistagni TaxID=359209 RepID=A0ABS0Z7B3_9GAMM|nr:Nif3-like dinuclear metal center hexameric protein [Marinomonas ostreistagni]MBJ7549542.1 Nif3-like dinuclear metal center hexameric protein [Marinomonas ostreistagni]
MNIKELESKLTALFQPKSFKDYAPNGLQVEGKAEIKKIVTGVTASMALIDEAIERSADAIIVHHGYFWKGEAPEIVGMKYRRLSALIKQDINLFGYHLPMDAHLLVGNNANLARGLGLQALRSLEVEKTLEESIGIVGTLEKPVSPKEFQTIIEKVVGREVLFECVSDDGILNVALCTGGAQGYISKALAAKADVFITGEVSEQTIHIAREEGMHFCAAGHHATECFGPRALANYIADNWGIECEFIDVPNPA